MLCCEAPGLAQQRRAVNDEGVITGHLTIGAICEVLLIKLARELLDLQP
jgi:hypothetical protein